MRKYLIILMVFLAVACSPYQKALRKHNKLTDREQLALSSVYADASREKILGHVKKAKDLYEFILTKDPLHDASLYELSLILGSEGKTDEAIDMIDLAVKIDPDNKWYGLAKAKILEKGARFIDAAKVYRELISKETQNYDLYLAEAECYLNANDVDKAIKIYDELEEILGVSEEISIRKYYIYLMSRKDDEAVKELEKLCDNFPGNFEYLNILIEYYMLDGKLSLAYERIKQLQELDPNNAYAHIYLSNYYRAAGLDDMAEKELFNAVSNENLDIDEKVKLLFPFYDFGSAYGDTLLLYSLMDTLVYVHPDEAKAWAMYADILRRNNNPEAAIEKWEMSLQCDSSKFLVWESLMIALYEVENYQKLEIYSSKSVVLYPEQGLSWFFNGLSYFETKEYEGALMPLEMALDLIYENKELKTQTMFLLAESYNHTRKYQKSDQMFDKLILLEPNNYIALNNYAYYSALRGENLEKAEERILKVVELNPNNPGFLDTYAYILFCKKEYNSAEQFLQQSLRAGGDKDGTIVEHYGDVLFFLDKKEKAIEYWEKAKDLGGTSENIERKIDDEKYYE